MKRYIIYLMALLGEIILMLMVVAAAANYHSF
jgi:hypothetical protein